MRKVAHCCFQELNTSLHGMPSSLTQSICLFLVRAGLINHCDRLCDEAIPSVFLSLRRGYPAEAALHPSHCWGPAHCEPGRKPNITVWISLM